jgi:hypothetical protein
MACCHLSVRGRAHPSMDCHINWSSDFIVGHNIKLAGIDSQKKAPQNWHSANAGPRSVEPVI